MQASAPEQTRQTYEDLIRRERAEAIREAELETSLGVARMNRENFANAARALVAVYPDLAPPIDPAAISRPTNVVSEMTGKDAVRRFLTENPDNWFTISDMIARILHLGWLSGSYEENENRVRVGTIRLHKTGVLDRKSGPGRGFLFKIKAPTEAGAQTLLTN